MGRSGSRRQSGVRGLKAKLFVQADADEGTLRAIWEQAVAGSPVTQTVAQRPESKRTSKRLSMRFVDREWVEARLGSPAAQVLDPRSKSALYSGHLRGAIHVPWLRHSTGRRPCSLMRRWWGGLEARGSAATSLPSSTTRATAGWRSMLAWILEYIGHPDVSFMREAFERWRTAAASSSTVPSRVDHGHVDCGPGGSYVRTGTICLIRPSQHHRRPQPGEFSGELVVGEDPSGHIPGATNLPWLRFVDGQPDLFATPERVQRLFTQAGLRPDRPTLVYCRVGMRAPSWPWRC